MVAQKEGARLMRRTSFAFAAFLLMLVLACATTVLNASRTYSATSPEFEAKAFKLVFSYCHAVASSLCDIHCTSHTV